MTPGTATARIDNERSAMLARSPRQMTVDQFLDIYEGVEGRYELVNGVVYAMAGGTVRHARVGGRITAALEARLAGTGCQPFNADMGLRLTDETIRYPDAAVYCDPRDLDLDDVKARDFRHPKVIFEVLSPSTEDDDRGLKVVQYKRLASVAAIVLVDPVGRRIEVHERRAADDWLHRLLPPGSDLHLADPPVVLTDSDIFGPV